MKKITLTLLGLTILSCFCFAQTNTFPASGSVGIGTTSPGSNLQIGTLTTTSTATPLTLSLGGTYSNTAGANLKLKLYDDGTSLFGFGISVSQLDAIIPTGGNFAWYVGGSQKLILNGAGNVGIGTATPNAGNKLEVSGSVATVPSGGFWVNSARSAGVADEGAGGAGDGSLYFRSGNADGRMVINASGNVGINTTNTQGYKLAVNGSVIAGSVNIKPYANWPDYVFKPAYQLPSLADVKTYIDNNQHLPDMPSAADVEKDGINVGQMNTLLTKKVEELTLYLIEKDKTEKEQKAVNDQQAARLKSQQEQIDQLKQQMNLLIKASNKN